MTQQNYVRAPKPNPTQKLIERIDSALGDLIESILNKDVLKPPPNLKELCRKEIIQACKDAGLKFVPEVLDTGILRPNYQPNVVKHAIGTILRNIDSQAISKTPLPLRKRKRT